MKQVSRDPFRFGEAYFEPDTAKKYGERHHQKERQLSHRSETRAILALLGAPSEPGHSLVLDAPSGSGRFVSALEDLGFRVVAMDRAATMTEQASIAGAEMTVTGSLAEIPLADRSVDAAICIRFLHHFAERRERVICLRELKRVARGPIVVSAWILHPMIRFKQLIRRKSDGSRFAITMSEWHATLAAAGLQATAKRWHVRFWSPLVYFRVESLPPDSSKE